MVDILSAVSAAQPDFAVLHFRTVKESYQALPGGWQRLARARELAPNLKLLGSGDIFSARDALAMHECSGVDGVVVARGLLRNPRILLQIEKLCAGKGEEDGSRHPLEALAFLRDIAIDSSLSPGSGNGFVLNLAAHMLGRDHELFGKLSHCGTLAETRGLLERIVS